MQLVELAFAVLCRTRLRCTCVRIGSSVLLWASAYHGGMKVLLASPRGFCAGVNMAIESLDLALASLAPPIYVYHEIVHNKYVVEHFRGRGVTFVDDLADVPLGLDAAVLGPWRVAGDSPHRPRAEPAGDRRHLPAGDQGAPGSDQVRRARATRSC